jgi:GT2 family glycosyltransferase
MFSENPLVSIVALCYNHEKYVIEALQSVVNQTYPNIELIIVDDFSTDGSREKISTFVKNHPSVQVIFNEKNLGNCKAFNRAFKISKGKYLIDLSTDDVMLPNRVEEQVKLFESSDKIGVVFSDADFIDEESSVYHHSKFNYWRKRIKEFPIGEVYAKMVGMELYINAPTMMIRRSILEQLGGYDESLTFEDLDIWIRAARISEFSYVSEVLMYHRILSGSHSTKFIQKNNILLPTSVIICQKVLALNKNREEDLALIIRLRTTLRQCLFTEHFEQGKIVNQMLEKLQGHNWLSKMIFAMILLKIPVNSLYLRYIKLRKYLQYKF